MNHPETINDVPTPSFLVDIDIVERNCRKMAEKCQKMSIGLRPHMKTHKTIEAGILMTDGTRRKVVVSTLAEAEHFANAGFDDILYGMVVVQSKLPRCKKVAESLSEFHVMIDSELCVDWLGSLPLSHDRKWSIFMMIDCGYHGTGVPFDSEKTLSIARRVQASHLMTLKGLYTHDGLTYSARGEEIAKVNDEFSTRLLSVWDRLREAGITVEECTTGSTPGASVPGKLMNRMTEIHPGNYVFYDWEQSELGSCHLSDVACRVATTVIGNYPDSGIIIVDCGFTAISHDKFPESTSYARFCDDENLELYDVKQEIGRVRAKKGKLDFQKYPVGSILYMYPFHSCATAAMHSQYYVHSGEKVIAVWNPCRGW